MHWRTYGTDGISGIHLQRILDKDIQADPRSGWLRPAISLDGTKLVVSQGLAEQTFEP
jgi:hypothetical protein